MHVLAIAESSKDLIDFCFGIGFVLLDRNSIVAASIGFNPDSFKCNQQPNIYVCVCMHACIHTYKCVIMSRMFIDFSS